ncbi:putative leucine-rich repeat receptor-like protein kinase [Vitis vinifera]|uniref:Putative leucine-rich repeat receptor-like protein kinase n=1 Tax=Vitis vinifera TaxID=29760 RepID=A0A438GCM6_VITVI|nr:putative leucine-rich repeat receptor-like protein kinase [Vitis vinifera]
MLISSLAVIVAITMSLAAKALFLVSAVVVIQFSGVVSQATNEYFPDEREALMQIRDIVNATVDLHKNWTGPPCQEDVSKWFGITCSKGHIIRIVLEGIELTGSFPPAFLQKIAFLNTVSFKNNSVFGPIPNLTGLIHLESVFFSQNNFSGSIPLDYIGLPNLTVLELQENSLGGHIPPFDQPTLTTFNVSYNHLEGPIPETPVLQRFPESSYDHNSHLCGLPLGKVCPAFPPAPATATAPPPHISPNPSKEKKKGLEIWGVALIVAAATLVPVLVMVVFLCYYRKSQRKEATTGQQTGEGSVEWAEKRRHSWESRGDPERTVALEFFDKDIPVFDLDDLLRASAEVMGKGKLGTTYKATLESGSAVAVKRLKDLNGLGKKEFVQQMQLLGKTRHENLVEIVSFYYSKEEKLVVYEFVPHGSLFELLHENRGAARVPLNWSRRLSIIKDIAKGLTFLHQSLPSHKVPHANLKSSNVLIHSTGQNCHSKLVDFGFLPLLPSRKSSEKLAVAKSPEFALGKKLTQKADVYCFGIIILEVITGRIPGEASPGINATVEDLSDWVRTAVNNDWSTDVLDVEIVAAREGHDEMLKLTGIALECTDTTPEKRPKMTEVLRRIQEIEDMGEKQISGSEAS